MTLPLEKKFMTDHNPNWIAMSLSVEKPDIPERISVEAKNNGLLPKEEFHISIVVSKNAKKLREVVSQHDDPERTTEELKELFESFAWEYTETDEYFLHEHAHTEEYIVNAGYENFPPNTIRSIVQKVGLPDISTLYAKVNEKLDIALTVPVPHITLFSWSDYEPAMLKGIGINSEEEFDAFTKKKL